MRLIMEKSIFNARKSTIMPSSEINDYNKIQIIYIIGFILNSYASDIYSSSSYMKESLALSDRAIDYLNKIDFENIVNIYENDDFQQLYNTTISLNASINRLFHFSILQNSDFLANGVIKLFFACLWLHGKYVYLRNLINIINTT